MENQDTSTNKDGRTPALSVASGSAVPPDAVAHGLNVGEQWGAYWLHGDGMMRLYPPHRASVAECLETLAHELECDPNYTFECLTDLAGETFKQKLDRVRQAVESAEELRRLLALVAERADFTGAAQLDADVDAALSSQKSNPTDADRIEHLARMWNPQGRGHHLMGHFFENKTGSFRDAVDADMREPNCGGEPHAPKF